MGAELRTGVPMAVRRLVCGQHTTSSQLGEVVSHLGSSIETLIAQIEAILTEDGYVSSRNAVLYGPFLGRSILEVSTTVLIGRMDPFRLLTLRKIQTQSDYELGKRTEAAIQWSGDVLAAAVAKAGNSGIWVDRPHSQMTRALLGDYHDHLLWRPAYERFLDVVPVDRGGEWVRTLRHIPPEGFIASVRRKCSEYFSECSKGIHHEILISGNYFTKKTVETLLLNIVETTVTISGVFNMCDHVAFSPSVDEVIADIEQVQRAFDLEGSI